MCCSFIPTRFSRYAKLYLCKKERLHLIFHLGWSCQKKKNNRKTCVSFKSYQWFLGTKLMEVYEFVRCLLHPLACVVNSSNQFPIYWVEEFYRIQGGCISRGFSSFQLQIGLLHDLQSEQQFWEVSEQGTIVTTFDIGTDQNQFLTAHLRTSY